MSLYSKTVPRFYPVSRQPGRAVPIGPVRPLRLAPEGAFPVARLPQQMVPADGPIVLRLEEELRSASVLIARFSVAVGENEGGHVVPHEVVETADQSSVVGEARGRGQEGLRHAECLIHPRRLPPFGDDIPVLDDQPRLRAAVFEGPDRRAVGLTPERHLVVELQIARRGGLGGDRERDGRLEQVRIEPHRLRRAPLPLHVGDRPITLGRELGREGERRRGEDSDQRDATTELDGHRVASRWKGRTVGARYEGSTRSATAGPPPAQEDAAHGGLSAPRSTPPPAPGSSRSQE